MRGPLHHPAQREPPQDLPGAVVNIHRGWNPSEGAMMAATIKVNGATLEPGAPVMLFPTSMFGGGAETRKRIEGESHSNN